MPGQDSNILKQVPNWKQLLQTVGNRGIVQNIPLILYGSFLAILYITLNHEAENTIRRINETGRQLKELRWKYVDEKTQIMGMIKESQLEKSVSHLHLQKTKVPPHKIIVSQSIQHENQ
ncbi:MAG: hypothetical protein KBF25_06280 [Chitinophagaceae bacterium]|jgi:cellobiose-specific phosphotransferase system component IIC|nr:hypothetical protein [Bacteroidota bacterium]MBP9933280.1 hypothetical protein [Chitinophagaceae bacterium]